MMQKLIIACYVISFFHINFAMDNIQKKQSSKLKLKEFEVQRIGDEQILECIGKPILYKINHVFYKRAILGEKVSGTESYQIYLTNKDGKYNSGICCLRSDLYLLASGKSLERDF